MGVKKGTRSLWVLAACVVPLLAGCSGSAYYWQVKTDSTPRPPSFNPALFEREPVAVLETVARPGLQGNEVGLSLSLMRILKRVNPNWKVVSPQETATRINQKGLADEYTKMRMDYGQSNILAREPLQKIGSVSGARYALQPLLRDFTQTTTERWTFPGLEFRISQTRSSILRLALQLWDTQTGELIWASTAEATLQGESVAQDPVHLEEAVRVTWASMITDFTRGKTSSKYDSVNKFLDSLIREEVRQEPQQNKD